MSVTVAFAIGAIIGLVPVYFAWRSYTGQRRALSKFDHDGDGRPGGSLPKGKG